MRSAIRVMHVSTLASVALAASVAVAAPTQLLLSENFQGVTRLTSAATIRTLANAASQINGSPVATFTNTGNGNASATSFNVRRDDNAIDGTSASATATLGNNTFDNFFLPLQTGPVIRNSFLVIGDDSGNLGGNANGGSTANPLASSKMSVSFALAPSMWTASDLLGVNIAFDYVFDADSSANLDDFFVDLVLANNNVVNLLNLLAPSVDTRGAFSAAVVGPVAAIPASLRFTLVEGRNLGSSAVGIDNIQVTAVPEPGALALVGLALLGLGLTRRGAR